MEDCVMLFENVVERMSQVKSCGISSRRRGLSLIEVETLM